jgi:RNA methyltransferase, TrmH family
MVDQDPRGPITSIHNPAIKRARSLLRRKGRIEERAFLVEGVRAVRDVLAAGVIPERVYVRDAPEDLVTADGLPSELPIRLVTPAVLASISDVPHPQGIIAEVRIDAIDTNPKHDVWDASFVVVADGIRDPGNLGTLLRSAAGAGVTEVLVTPESVDPFNPKCVRAAMGSHFLVSITEVTFDQLVHRLAGIPLVAIADANGDLTYDEPDWTQPCAVVVGGEAFGHHAEVTRLASANVRIPLARNLESLNAGVAGSHVILEVSRQRRLAQEH